MRIGRVPRARWWIALAAALAIGAALVSCSQVQRAGEEPLEPRSYEEVNALVERVRAFEERIGFRPTKNFRRFSEERASFPFCGHAPHLYLPYSYEDPGVKWYAVATEQECRSSSGDVDIYFGHSEALGEIETPVTPAMLTVPLSRLIYLVVHEDCHEQFDLPYGIEEPLCNVIAYRALPVFAREQYGRLRAEYYAVGRYAYDGSSYARTTIRFYDELAALYTRHAKLNSDAQVVLMERGGILKRAGRALGWETAEMNNVLLANAMTYSRHYPFVERVLDALGGDIARTVAFFREVDAARPTQPEILARHALTTVKSVEYLRAYEGSVVETAERLLGERSQQRAQGARKSRS
ncbi:MAG: hypothetical protein ACXW2I_00405 [Burkholderiales bacterium]